MVWRTGPSLVAASRQEMIRADEATRRLSGVHRGFDAGIERGYSLRCSVPACDGVSLTPSQRNALWANFFMGAPRPRTPFE